MMAPPRLARLLPAAMLGRFSLLSLFFISPAFGVPRAEFVLDDPESAAVDEIEVDRIASDAPHVELAWTLSDAEEHDPDAYQYVLQQDDSPDFPDPRDLYAGRDRASFRAGLPEGDHFYRVRALSPEGEAGAWSRPLQVAVTYQSMRLALSLFSIGAVVVVATAVLVIAGSRRDRQEARAEERTS